MRASLTTEEISDFRKAFARTALQSYLAEGFPGISMRKVASKLGVSQATAYRYFADKEEVLSVVRAAAVEHFVEALLSARGSLRSNAAARVVGQAYLDYALANPELYRLIFDVHQPDPGRYRELAAATDKAREIMSAYVEEMAQDGLISESPGPLSVILWSGAHGLIMNYLSGLIEERQELFDLHRQMMRRLLASATAD